ncbi:MAG: response regulator [Flavobacteriales bacterium]|nr:response regulator [Flavobacteriales bacterium]
MEPLIQNRDVPQPTLRALVVDDREDVAMSLALLLKHMGYTVQVAFQAKEALMKGTELQPDVVFLDIGLPDLSGYEVCKEIRATDWGLNSFIVAVTGRNGSEDLLRAANCGFDRHVVKPMDGATLKEILQTVKTRVLLSARA